MVSIKHRIVLYTGMLIISFFVLNASCNAGRMEVKFENRDATGQYFYISNENDVHVKSISLHDRTENSPDRGTVWLIWFVSDPVKEKGKVIKGWIRYGDKLGGDVSVAAKPLKKGHTYVFEISTDSSYEFTELYFKYE